VDEDTRQPAPPDIVLNAGASPASVPVEPSWGRVLATTVKVWVSRRLRPAGSGKAQPAAPRWRLAALLAVALAVIAVAAWQFTGVFTRTAATAARAPSPAGNTGTTGTSSGAAAPQAEAAAWIAGQVSADAIVACDPAMCAALQAQGVSAGRLMPLPAGTADPHGAAVMVTSTSARSQLAMQYAPAVIASFGSGNVRIEVCATEPGGAAAYRSALRADLATRQGAGSQLLRNSRIQFNARDAAQLRAGDVDSRLLVTLAALWIRYSFRVTSFGDGSPGVPALFREVTITSGGSQYGAAQLAAALALVKAQDPPYLPDHAWIVHPAAGQAALHIQFAAPSPLGLLTAVFRVHLQRAAAPTTLSTGASPLGGHGSDER
jgi:hypothetical protein